MYHDCTWQYRELYNYICYFRELLISRDDLIPMMCRTEARFGSATRSIEKRLPRVVLVQSDTSNICVNTYMAERSLNRLGLVFVHRLAKLKNRVRGVLRLSLFSFGLQYPGYLDTFCVSWLLIRRTFYISGMNRVGFCIPIILYIVVLTGMVEWQVNAR